ncbi:OmpH family outer membrane protein [Winogradskyella sp. 3972H.M.0a.05]|uniref:OmpH family outer membrane protein n=1 Tax=Winogradskyella sp. 3972H.M.0a.05 TaxID=2950277 RepID=UPI00339B5A67
MKRLIILSALILTVTSCQEQAKIGFVDNGKVINDYQAKIDIEEKYKVKEEAYKRKTDSVGQAYNLDLQAMQVKLKNASARKQQEESQQFSQKWQIVQQQLQFEQQQMQQAFNVEIDSAIIKMNDFVKDYGKKNGFTYILGSNQAGSVLYGDDTNDLTQVITDALNEAYKKE